MARKQSGTFALYGTILVCALVFFLLGVYVGSRMASDRPRPAAASTAQQPVDDPRPQLDFYEELMPREGDPQGTGEATSEDASGPAPQEPADAQQPDTPAVETPVEGAASEPSPAPAPGPDVYTIQVAAFKTAPEARQVLIRLQAKGYDAKLVEPTQADPQFYRVWVGGFDRRAEATKLEARLKADDFPTYLKKVPAGRLRN